MVLVAAFGIGFSLPLSAILFEVSFGKAEAATRVVAGVLLTGVGLYLLAWF